MHLFHYVTLVCLLLASVALIAYAARTRSLRDLTQTLEAQVKRRTSELEGTLRNYERTTEMLELVREKMELEIEERKETQARLEREREEQRRLIHELEEAHVQLLQSEKLASIGQLAAGVAHEINNPIGFVSANLNTLKLWIRGLLQVAAAQEAIVAQLDANTRAELLQAWQDADLDFVREEIMALIDESIDGTRRVHRIVRDLRDFSRPGSEDWAHADLHAGLESTLNVVNNELKYKATIVREFGELPHVECIPSQINQVFMNLLVNAAQAIPQRGTITIRTYAAEDNVSIEIADDGVGISTEVVGRIFDPFFTTKPVGQGTGLGLSVSLSIVKRHGGRIEVATAPGQGAVFIVRLPVRREPVEQPDVLAASSPA
ncbi:phospho-acceptor domain-containing protein [Trinickia symbiotica]|nr:phospho-acceptor domain-containing protein [Trinickia symbiotica]